MESIVTNKQNYYLVQLGTHLFQDQATLLSTAKLQNALHCARSIVSQSDLKDAPRHTLHHGLDQHLAVLLAQSLHTSTVPELLHVLHQREVRLLGLAVLAQLALLGGGRERVQLGLLLRRLGALLACARSPACPLLLVPGTRSTR